MKHFKKVVIATFVVVAALLYAAPAQQAAALSSASLSIVPKKNYTIEAGKSVKDTLTIHNLDSSQELDLTLRIIDFTYTDNGGTPKLLLDTNAPQTTWSLKPFLVVPKSVVVAPGATTTVNMSVAIPSNQGAGSYYSAILYSSGTPDGGNVGLSASGVTLVFTSVPGLVNEDLKVQKFGAYIPETQSGKTGYVSFTTNKPLQIAYTLKNNGNVTESPVGSISYKYMFGKEQQIDNVNPTGSLALIGQTRMFFSCIKLEADKVDFNGTKTTSTTCANPGLWPGRYTTKLDLFYGQNGNQTQELVSVGSFWYMPWWSIIILIVLVLLITFVIWKFVRFVKVKIYGLQPKKSRRRK